MPGQAPNLTPMIDVTFLLLIFFLLTMRFVTLERRLEARLPGVGMEPYFVRPPDLDRVRASLVRRDAGAEGAWTRIRIGERAWESKEYFDPAFPAAGDAEAARRRRAGRARLFGEVRDHVRALVEARGPGSDLRGWVDAPMPLGPLVPTEDVAGVVDALIGACVREIEFTGTAPPGGRR